MAKTLVRTAVSKDFRLLVEIDQASFSPDIAYDSDELAYFIRRHGAKTLVSEVDDEIAGFILFEISSRRRFATIITLDVVEQQRRKGVASQLLKASEDVLRVENVLRYELQVDVNNSSAISFYKKHGFEIVRTLPNYYSNDNDAYLMIKPIG